MEERVKVWTITRTNLNLLTGMERDFFSLTEGNDRAADVQADLVLHSRQNKFMNANKGRCTD